jgi:predicted dehydrogenase
MMVDPVRLGIIGTGAWAQLMYLNVLTGREDVEVAAIAGRDSGRLAEIADRYGVAGRYTDYRQLLDHPRLDGVVVVTPDDLHLPMALAVIERGLHVLCEKPLANSSTDARRMLEAAERRGVNHIMLFTWRWQPHYQYLKSLFEQEAFGTVYRAQFSFLNGFGRDPAYQWRLDPSRANGVTADLGSHLIDLARWFFGDVTTVSAALGTSISRSDIPGHDGNGGHDTAHLSLGFANGVLGVIDVSMITALADTVMRQTVRIEAEKATLELEHNFFGRHAGLSIRWIDANEGARDMTVPREYYGASDPANPFDIYVTEPVGVLGFVAAIRENRRPEPDFAVALEAQRVVDAARLSARESRVVSLPDPTPAESRRR